LPVLSKQKDARREAKISASGSDQPVPGIRLFISDDNDIQSDSVGQEEIDHTLLLDSTTEAHLSDSLPVLVNNQLAVNDNITRLTTALARKKEGAYLQAIQIFSSLAEQENLFGAQANYQLGKMFQQGLGVESDEEKATHYFHQASKVFDPLAGGGDKSAAQANYQLGKMSQQGLGVVKNEKTAKRYYKIAQVKGSAKASTKLGELCKEEKKYVKAKVNYQAAIFQSPGKGSAQACNRLAGLYQQGLGTKPNREKAIASYQEAIKKGNDNAYIDLGNLYRDERDYEQELACYRQGKGAIAALACLELGDLYGEAIGIEGNFDKAALCYQEAEGKGSVDACIKLGDLCCVTKNLDQAFVHYQRASGEIAAKSFDYLGHLFREIDQVDIAIKCYRIAGDKGCVEAWLHLGDLYKEQSNYDDAFLAYQPAPGKSAAKGLIELGGLYFQQRDRLGNRDKAINCYELAEKKGKEINSEVEQKDDAEAEDDVANEACIFLGDLYQAEEKYEEAFQCYQRAEGKIAARACHALGHFHRTTEDKEKGYPQTIMFYEAAVKKGLTETLIELGLIYRIKQEYQRAEDYFQQAGQKGLVDACIHLGDLYVEQGKYKQALDSYQQGQGLGAAQACRRLGNILNAQFNVAQAIQCFEEAEKKGSVEASNDLGCIYRSQKVFQKAALYFEKAKNFLGEAANNLGRLHLDGHLGETPDDAIAMTCFQKAVALGYAKANSNIGYFYYKGLGGSKKSSGSAELLLEGKRGRFAVGMFLCWRVFPTRD